MDTKITIHLVQNLCPCPYFSVQVVHGFLDSFYHRYAKMLRISDLSYFLERYSYKCTALVGGDERTIEMTRRDAAWLLWKYAIHAGVDAEKLNLEFTNDVFGDLENYTRLYYFVKRELESLRRIKIKGHEATSVFVDEATLEKSISVETKP